MNQVSQTLQLQRFLATGESITPLKALRKFGIFRLSGRIYDLRQMGWPIKSTLVDVGGKKVASYSFMKGKKA
jgi:hypothetical protein